MPDRRSILQLLALSPLATLPSSCAAASDTNDPAAAWRNPGAGQSDPRLYSLAHAILAPNPHNRQPWLVSLADKDSLTLYFDTQRRLPATDPFDRQLAVGCGAFLELLVIAAAQIGYQANIRLFPEGEPQPRMDDRPVARVTLIPGAAARDPLFAHITQRRSNKQLYDSKKAISPETLARLLMTEPDPSLFLAGALRGDPTCEALREISIQAYRREIETPVTLKESVDLMRIGKAEIARYRDGIPLDFPGIGLMQATGMLTREKLMTPGSSIYKQGLEQTDPLAKSAAGYVWLVTRGNTRQDQIAAGRAYARLNLRATALDLAMHPMSQALQEFPEMAEFKSAAEKTVQLEAGHCVQMLARIGYGKSVPPAPRRGLSEHLRT